MILPRNSFGAIYNNGYIYVAGGISENYKTLDTNEDPILD